jgi:7-cyano-7-deazaguanine reductase
MSDDESGDQGPREASNAGTSRAEILDRFKAPDRHQINTFETDELTALCPFDFGGPDFYDLTIRYVPDQYAVEAKSLKQYIASYRDEEITAEQLADRIYEDVHYIAAPDRMYVRLEQARRGGIEETVEVGDRELRP